MLGFGSGVSLVPPLQQAREHIGPSDTEASAAGEFVPFERLRFLYIDSRCDVHVGLPPTWPWIVECIAGIVAPMCRFRSSVLIDGNLVHFAR